MPERLKTSDRLVGVKQVQKAVLSGKTRVVFIAEDAGQKVIAPILDICGEKGVQVVYVPTKKRLGELCGIEVGASAAAVLTGPGL